jgi:hypothetical protein
VRGTAPPTQGLATPGATCVPRARDRDRIRSGIDRYRDRASPVSPPAGSRLSRLYEGADLVDAYMVTLPFLTISDVGELARFVLAHPPGWVAPLMAIRDALMGTLGIKTAADLGRQGRATPNGVVGSFPMLERSPSEVVMGADDRHLDFRTSMLVTSADEGRVLTWTTVVRCRNGFGRGYLTLIAPFHRAIVPAYLDRAAAAGWPEAIDD